MIRRLLHRVFALRQAIARGLVLPVLLGLSGLILLGILHATGAQERGLIHPELQKVCDDGLAQGLVVRCELFRYGTAHTSDGVELQAYRAIVQSAPIATPGLPVERPLREFSVTLYVKDGQVILME